MKHITERIPAWLAGDLDQDAVTDLEHHLERCPDCARSAHESRALWEALGTVAFDEISQSTPSVWSAVRTRTIAENISNSWFYGPSSLARVGLATAAVAAGLVFAVMLPGGGLDEVPNPGDQQVETLWLEESSWAATDQDYDLDKMWLSAGMDTEG